MWEPIFRAPVKARSLYTMLIDRYKHDEHDERPDPYRLSYRFFSALFVVFGVLWLSIYKQDALQAAKLALLIAGLCWSGVPRLRSHGIGSLVPDLGRLRTSGKVIAALAFLLTVYGFAVVSWSDFTLGQMIHWFTGGMAILIGMDTLMRSFVSGKEKTDEDEPESGDEKSG